MASQMRERWGSDRGLLLAALGSAAARTRRRARRLGLDCATAKET